MSPPENVEDPSPDLRQAIALARDAGFQEPADEFEASCFAPYATTNEWLGELGDAIRRFRAACDRALPREVEILLQRAMLAVRQAAPDA